MKIKPFNVSILSYITGILALSINGKRYEYEVSPYTYRKFERMRNHNKGRALQILRGHELDIVDWLNKGVKK